MKDYKFGIIGCGFIAERHAKHIQEYGKLLCVCDIIEEKSKRLASQHHCQAYSDIDTMLGRQKDLDIVSVCTPNGLHAEHSIKALKAGLHVLCEKPMALSVRDCERMIKAAEDANKRLFVVKQNRFNPPIQALKKAVDQGVFGKLYSAQLNCFWNRNAKYYLSSDWKGKKALDGGVLYTQFSHFIDILYWIFGDVKSVKAHTRNFNHVDVTEFEDTGVVILEFENGGLGTIHFTTNSCHKNMEGSLTVFGEKGTVKIGGQYLNVLEYQEIEGYKIEHIPVSSPANDYGYYQGSMSNHDKVYLNVIDALNDRAPIMTSSMDGLKTVQIIEKIYNDMQI